MEYARIHMSGFDADAIRRIQDSEYRESLRADIEKDIVEAARCSDSLEAKRCAIEERLIDEAEQEDDELERPSPNTLRNKRLAFFASGCETTSAPCGSQPSIAPTPTTCTATTKRGKPCKLIAKSRGLCHVHMRKLASETN